MFERVRGQLGRLRSHARRCETAAVAVGVEALLRLYPLPHVCQVLGVQLLHEARRADRSTPRLAKRVARVRSDVEWAYARLGLPDTCLRRCLTAGFQLRAYHPRLVIGVKKAQAFDAHAWLVTRGVVLDWAYQHGQYIPMR